jgi:hypothetical protein
MEDNVKNNTSDNLEGASEEPEISSTPGSLPDRPEAFAEPEAKEPTRFQKFMRKALTWLAVVAVAFGAGFATFYFTLFQDKVEQLEQVEISLTEAEQTAVNLEDQLEKITAERDDLANAQDYRTLLSIMVDIYAARSALTDKNTSAAKSAISDTEDTLDEMIDVIRDFDTNLAETLPQRLRLIRANIDGNIENAIADCDLMIKDLRDIEKSLYQ